MSDDDDLYSRDSGMMGKVRNVLVGVLVGMLVLAFAVWGVEDVFSPNSSNAVVQVGDQEVDRFEFRDRFNDQMREFAQANGGGITNEQAYDRGLPQQLIQQMQQELAIRADADDLGVAVNNRDVLRYVENIDAFRNEITQQFDKVQLQQLLASNQIRQEDFEDDVINALVQRQTLPAIMGGINAPSDYAQRFNTFVNEVRSAKLIRFGADSVDPIAPPTDAELASYVAANQARYTDPEYRRFLMLRLEPFDFIRDVEVTDEDVRERFDTLVRVGEIGAVESRDVLVLTTGSQELADLAAAQLNDGGAPAEVASALSLPAPDRFDSIKENALLNPASSEVAFAVDAGQARVAPTEFGTFEIVYVEKINAAEIPDFSSMADEIRADLLEGQARRQIGDYERIIDDMILEGSTLEEIAEEINAPLSSYPYISRTGRTQDGIVMNGFAGIPGIATDEALLTAIFTGDIGFESDITSTSNNGLAVFRITDIIEATPKPIDDIREAAIQAWTQEKIGEALVAKGVSLAARLRGGETIEALASELGTDVQRLAMQRANPPRDVSPMLVVGLLDGDPGDVARGPAVSGSAYEVAVLETVSAGDERISGQLLRTVQETLSEQIALDISRAYESAILNDKSMVVYDGQLRNALGLDPASN